MSNQVKSRHAFIKFVVGVLALGGALLFASKFNLIVSLPLPVPESIELRLNEYNRLIANANEIELEGAFTLDKGKYRIKNDELGDLYIDIDESTNIEAHVITEISSEAKDVHSVRITPSLKKFDIKFSNPLTITGNNIKIATLNELNSSNELTGNFSLRLANIVAFGLVSQAAHLERSANATTFSFTNESISSITLDRLVMRFKDGAQFPTSLGTFINTGEMRISFTNINISSPKQAQGNIEVIANSIIPPEIESNSGTISLKKASMIYRGEFKYQSGGLTLLGEHGDLSLTASNATIERQNKSVNMSSVLIEINQIDAFIDGNSASSSLKIAGRISTQALQYKQQDKQLKLQLATNSPWQALFSATSEAENLTYKISREHETVVAIQALKIEKRPAVTLDTAKITFSPFSVSSLQDVNFEIPRINISTGTLRIGDNGSKWIGLIPSSTLKMGFDTPLVISPFKKVNQANLNIDIEGKAKHIAIHDTSENHWDFHDMEISAHIKEKIVSGVLSLSATHSKLGDTSLAALAKDGKVSIDKMKFTYDGDRFRVPSLPLQLSLRESAVLDRLRKELSKPTKPNRGKIPGRDFGRILSLGTVKDYRSMTQVSGVTLNHAVFNGKSANVGVGGKITVALEAEVLMTGTKKCWTKGVKPCTKWLVTDLPFGGQLKTKVPGLCETKWKADCPHVYHDWTKAASATIKANVDGQINLNPSVGRRLIDLSLHPTVKLKNIDINNVPDWLDKNFLTPFAKSFVKDKDLGKVQLFESTSEKTNKMLDKFVVKDISINTVNGYIQLNIKMSSEI